VDYVIQSQIALNDALARKAHAEADLAIAHAEKMRAEIKRILAPVQVRDDKASR
jgi:hypothetical protein